MIAFSHPHRDVELKSQAVEHGGRLDVGAISPDMPAKTSRVPLSIVPISGGERFAPLRFQFAIAMGVRKGDHALRDQLDDFIVQHAAEITDSCKASAFHWSRIRSAASGDLGEISTDLASPEIAMIFGAIAPTLLVGTAESASVTQAQQPTSSLGQISVIPSAERRRAFSCKSPSPTFFRELFPARPTIRIRVR